MTESSLPIETALRWFGPSWGAQVCNPAQEVETPAGAFCRGMCSKAIQPGDQGLTLAILGPADQPPTRVPYHLSCLLVEVVGAEGWLAAYHAAVPESRP